MDINKLFSGNSMGELLFLTLVINFILFSFSHTPENQYNDGNNLLSPREYFSKLKRKKNILIIIFIIFVLLRLSALVNVGYINIILGSINFLLFALILLALVRIGIQLLKYLEKLEGIFHYVFNYKYAPILYCFFIPFFYLFFILMKFLPREGLEYITLSENSLYRINIVMSIGLIISEIFVYKGLISCMNNAGVLIDVEDNTRHYNKYTGIFTWAITLILNLYCQVIVITYFQPSSFCAGTSPVSNFLDMFYYTIVTFATIGYGDILPQGILGKLQSINIIVSGFFFVIIFIATIISAQISKSNEHVNVNSGHDRNSIV